MKTHKHLLLACNLILATTVAFSAPQWTWEAGKQTNNGAITLKSTNSSNTYSGTQNPTGAIAKTNQTAATQPPTVIIQSTSGGIPFNYKDDCWVFQLSYGNVNFIGAGKVDTAASKFTGVMGAYNGSGGYAAGGQAVLTALLGAGGGGSSAYNPYWCGSDASCAWINGSNIGYAYVVGVAALPIAAYQKCYP